MSDLNIVIQTESETVVAEYRGDGKRSTDYQSEAELERDFIRLLQEQGYEYLGVTNEEGLIANLRTQLEKLNDITFSDSEWQRFFTACLASPQEDVVDKTRKIQEGHVQILTRDDGSFKNIYLLDKKNIHRNSLQVINQYEVEGTRTNRYDVTVLVNGLPIVHVELKRRGINIREAFNQIKRYGRESFWTHSALFDYVQLFVISNGTQTKYYSNTTRRSHVREQEGSRTRKGKRTSNSFEFTSFWTDARNKRIADLVDFTKTFFVKHCLMNVLTKYCVFTADELLLVMRPYQIAATERILNRIEVASNYKQWGRVEGGGYIWHTTGSGKTLTSFKTAMLASKMSDIDKVLFVVDRKDLDYQTVREYEKFAKGSVNSNSSTSVLAEQLTKPNGAILKSGQDNQPIIVTTIQKLDRFIGANRGHEIFGGHVVLIFDECHRSQFGDMHLRIKKVFRKYHLFGFTGTPIFAANASSGGNPLLRTTEQAFGERLHTYTIVDAINDGNVLKFHIDYLKTLDTRPDAVDAKIRSIDTKAALADPRRIQKVVEYILDNFNRKTKRNEFYSVKGRRLAGFNSMFAVSSIPMAMAYYAELQRQIAERDCSLKVAMIYSFSANEDDLDDVVVSGGIVPDEDLDARLMDKTSRDFLDDAISDYNAMFDTKKNFDTSSENFENYYKDLSERVKKREVDILLVVNMFLTGFDVTTLNTLWVDKNLRLHGLVQAFSRTNRILNNVKNAGNVVCFRDLERETNEAIAMFGDRDAGGIVLIRPYKDYMYGYEEDGGRFVLGYVELLARLLDEFPIDIVLVSEADKKEFVRLFGQILRVRNVLSAFDEFEEDDELSVRDLQDYQGIYWNIYDEMRPRMGEAEIINDDLVFEVELIKQTEINIDYILMMVAQYADADSSNKELKLEEINRAIDSSIELRSKKDLIRGFIERVNAQASGMDWRTFVEEQKAEDLAQIVHDEKLKPEETERFMQGALRDGELRTTGIDLDGLMPPVSLFTPDGERDVLKLRIVERLRVFFEKYLGLGS